MMYRKSLADYGAHVDADGVRWIVECCRRVRPSTGWTRFDTPEDCLAAWGLIYDPLPEPQPEPEN